MLSRYGLLGAGSGIAVALYGFSLIQKRTVRVADPAASIRGSGHGPLGAGVTPARLPSRADGNQLLGLVFAVEWGVLGIFVLSELLPDGFHVWLKLTAITCGLSIAVLYVLCVTRLRSMGLLTSPKPTKPAKSRSRRRRLRGRIRAHD